MYTRRIRKVWLIWWCNWMKFEVRLHISTILPRNVHGHGFAMWLTAWASGWRYTTAPQTVSDNITRSTRPSQFISHTLKNMGRPGYEANQNLVQIQHLIHNTYMSQSSKPYLTWLIKSDVHMYTMISPHVQFHYNKMLQECDWFFSLLVRTNIKRRSLIVFVCNVEITKQEIGGFSLHSSMLINHNHYAHPNSCHHIIQPCKSFALQNYAH